MFRIISPCLTTYLESLLPTTFPNSFFTVVKISLEYLFIIIPFAFVLPSRRTLLLHIHTSCYIFSSAFLRRMNKENFVINKVFYSTIKISLPLNRFAEKRLGGIFICSTTHRNFLLSKICFPLLSINSLILALIASLFVIVHFSIVFVSIISCKLNITCKITMFSILA